MYIALDNIGRKFNREWIFRGISMEMNHTMSYVILGGNGSGKSTFLQVLAGNLLSSEGSILYDLNGEKIPGEAIYKKVAFASPYMMLMEEYTLTEQLEFHHKLKPFFKELSIRQIIDRLGLKKHKDKTLKYYSSGMKQRVKLGLAIFSDTPVLLLDEPVSNLDAAAIKWYKEQVTEFKINRLVAVASNNQEDEFFFCEGKVDIMRYK